MSEAGLPELIVGIDLGTTNSLVAVAGWPSATVRPRVLGAGVGAGVGAGDAGLLPSVVRFDESGGVVVGEPAKREAAQHPRRTIASAKRLMGRSMADAAGDLPMLSYKVVEGPGRTARIELPAGDGAARVVSPQEVSAHVLAALKRRAEALLSAEVGRRVEVRKAVVTVPAYFDDAQRQATRDAARLAGLEAVRLVAEPTAAALAYGLGVRAASTLTRPDEAGGVPSGPGPTVTGADAGKLVVVYDLGGGTFDVSVLRIAPAGLGAEAFMVLATAGDTRLGGDDMDHAVVRWCAERLDALAPGSGTALLEDPGARRELLAGAERAKVLLSTSDSAIIEPPGGLPTLTLTRGDFEKLIEPLVERTLAACRRAVRDAQRAGAGLSLGPGAADNSGADRQAPAAVILVGGATRVPLVRARVARFFGVTPYTAIDPDCAVALGAAVQAGVLSGAEAGALLLDVIPLSLGIETAGGAMAKIVMRNSPVPAEAHEMFSTGVDGQTSVKLNILQGEREMAADCRSLGEFHLRGVPAMPAGIPQLRVTFRVDANAILSVSAVELRTGVRLDVQVVPNHGLTREEVERIELESFASAREDMRRHRVADLVANSTLDLGWIQRQLARHALALAPAQREAIELAAARLRGFVQEAGGPAGGGPDPDAFHAAKEALDRASIPLHEAAITSTLRASNQ